MRPPGIFKLVRFQNRRTGTISWRVSGTPRMLNAKRIQRNFARKDDAVAELHRLQDESLGVEAREVLRRTVLSLDQLADAEKACHLLAQAGAGAGASLVTAVTTYLDHAANRSQTAASPKASQALAQFLAEKEQSGRRGRTMGNLRHRLGKLVSAMKEGALVIDITSDLIRALVYREGQSAVSASNNLRAISSFTRWLVKRDLLPVDPTIKIDRPRLDSKEPKIFLVKQCQALMDAAMASPLHARAVPHFTLLLFAGIRPAELSRLKPGDLNLELGTVTVRGAAAKMRGRRCCELQPNALAFLKRYWDGKGPVHLLRKQFDAVRKVSGVKWSPDVCRHSALSYHLAQFGDENKTAQWGGTSPTMLHSHYRGLVQPGEAAKFWAIIPPPAAAAAPGERAPGDLIDALVFKAK